MGENVIVISLSNDSKIDLPLNLKIVFLNKKNKFSNLSQVFKLYDINACISYLERANLICSLVCYFTNTLFTASVHTAPKAAFKKRNFLNRIVIYLTYKFISIIKAKVFCVTEGIKDDLYNMYGIKNSRVISNFIDHSEIDSRIRGTEGCNEDIYKDIDILFVGRLSKVKGCDILIDALCEMKQFIIEHDVNAVIVGDGTERKSLEMHVSSSGLSEHIEFIGSSTNPYEFMQRARYLVVPSYAEGFGLVVLEGLYLGCDIIFSKCDFGPREIIGKYFKEQIQLGFSDPSKSRTTAINELSSLIAKILPESKSLLPLNVKKERVKEFFNKKKVALDILLFLSK
ncbi:glycosyltransferase [Erwinia sp. E_sp_B01_3]